MFDSFGSMISQFINIRSHSDTSVKRGTSGDDDKVIAGK